MRVAFFGSSLVSAYWNGAAASAEDVAPLSQRISPTGAGAPRSRGILRPHVPPLRINSVFEGQGPQRLFC